MKKIGGNMITVNFSPKVNEAKTAEILPDLPVAPQDEAGLTKTFQTWPRGWFHIP